MVSSFWQVFSKQQTKYTVPCCCLSHSILSTNWDSNRETSYIDCFWVKTTVISGGLKECTTNLLHSSFSIVPYSLAYLPPLSPRSPSSELLPVVLLPGEDRKSQLISAYNSRMETKALADLVCHLGNQGNLSLCVIWRMGKSGRGKTYK